MERKKENLMVTRQRTRYMHLPRDLIGPLGCLDQLTREITLVLVLLLRYSINENRSDIWKSMLRELRSILLLKQRLAIKRFRMFL